MLYKNGETLTEGDRGILWPDVDHKNIVAVMALGIQLPQGSDYAFTRQGQASLGQQVCCMGASVSVVVKDIRLVFEFKVTK